MSNNRVIAFPTVTLVSRTAYIAPAHLEWKANNLIPGAQAIAELAGRTCYQSFGEGLIDGHQSVKGRVGNKEYLDNIRKQKHGSVIEHGSFGFLIEGVSRSLTHELVRHRAGFAYSQLSQRFVDEGQVKFVKPPAIAFGTHEYERWLATNERALDAYCVIRDGLLVTMPKKKALEAARSVLPNATETKIVVTGNLRAWRHFVTKRGALGTDMEIRILTRQLLVFLQAEAPDVFDDFRVIMSDKLDDWHIKTDFEGV